MSKLWNTLKSVVGSASKLDSVAPAAAIVNPTPTTTTENPPVISPVNNVEQPSTGIFTNFASIKPHVPLIKFRKGLAPTVEANSGLTPEVITMGNTANGGSLEWWEVPNKFKREVIDELECEAINMGGREMPWC